MLAFKEWFEQFKKPNVKDKKVLDLWNWLNDGFIIRKSLPTVEELAGWFEQNKTEVK